MRLTIKEIETSMAYCWFLDLASIQKCLTYKLNSAICAECPLISQCTESENQKNLSSVIFGKAYIEEAEHLRHTKEKHGMRCATLREQKNCLCRRCLLLLP
jgi:hypothetical protein